MTQGYQILIYSISYFLFLALLWLSKAKKGLRLLNEEGPVANRAMLIGLHIGGIILFAAVPFYFFDRRLQDIVFGKTTPGSWQLLVISLSVILAIMIAPVLAEKNYRRTRFNRPVNIALSDRFVINYFFIRLLFLAAYETWFRGYLLTDCITSWNIPVAILINITLYALLHIVNGKNETLACVPFGLLLCVLTTWVHAAWPAILIHVALTMSHEIHLVKKNNKPSTSFV